MSGYGWVSVGKWVCPGVCGAGSQSRSQRGCLSGPEGGVCTCLGLGVHGIVR